MSEDLESIAHLTTWHPYHEAIFIEWADKASCYKFLHSMSYIKYSRKSNWYTIPVIIMSTLTGTANFAMDRIPPEYVDAFSISVGSINILAGIITTISQFLKLNELVENHRVSYISWDKFYRNIRTELVKSPEERTDVKYMLKLCKSEFDGLMETSPPIDKDILDKFKEKLLRGKSKEENEKKLKIYNELNKPELFNEIHSVKHVVYKRPTHPEKTNLIEKRELEKLKQQEAQRLKRLETRTKFLDDFMQKYNRYPSDEEINNNLEPEPVSIDMPPLLGPKPRDRRVSLNFGPSSTTESPRP
jgi:hypothetical protein